ncbi:Tetraspanin, partial [Gryllus bimaculatus]
ALLVFIFVSQLVVGILCFWYQQNETSEMLNTLLKWVLDYNKQPSQMTSYNLFVVQNELKCCGYFGVDDFQNVSDDAFPGSCCSSEKQNCSKSSKYTIKRGCKDELTYAISDFTNRIGGLALVTALLA